MKKNYDFFNYCIVILAIAACSLPQVSKAQISAVGCNYAQAWISSDFPALQASVPDDVGSAIPLCLGSVTNASRLIDSDLNNFANIGFALGLGVGANCDGTLSVKDNNVYPGGTYAGYRIGTSGLLGSTVDVQIEVSTYLNNSLQESEVVVSNLVGLNSDLLLPDGTINVGFVTDSSKNFDEIRIECTTLVAVLYNLNVYHAVVKKYCPGSGTVCNQRLNLTEHTSPVELTTAVSGLASVGGMNAQNIIDTIPNNYASVLFPVSVLSSASIQVRNVIDTFAAGHYAGFEMSTGALADVDILGSMEVSTYKDNIMQEVVQGNDLLISSSILDAIDTMRDVGFVTTKSFDEIRLDITQVLSVDLGEVRVRNAIVEPYCEGAAPGCGNIYWLNRPERTVVINEKETGVDGLACVLCGVENAANVIDTDTSTYSRMYSTASVVGGTELSVWDIQRDYPAGSVTGFAIRNINNLLEIDLLNNLQLTTYLDGNVQEYSHGAGSLLNIALLQGIGGSDVINVAFRTTKPFDEVKISYSAVASALNEIHVYGAFVDTRMAKGLGLYCYEHYPDIKVGLINDTLTGNLSTNDNIGSPAIYSEPVVSTNNPTAQLPVLNPDGTYEFITNTPGEYNFTYSICIDTSNIFCETQMLTITVIDQNDTLPPVANTDIAKVRKNQAVTIPVLENDKAVNKNGSLGTPIVAVSALHGTVGVLPNGEMLYTPNSNFVGVDTFIYAIQDTVYNTTDSAYVFINVLDDDYPNSVLAVDDHYQTLGNDSVVGNLLANDIDPDGDSIFAIPQTITSAEGTLVISSNGDFVFHPAPGFEGDYSIPYTVLDTDSTSPNATATIHILVLKSPDLVVTLFSTPNVVQGATNIDLFINISEINGIRTEGLVTVSFPKDIRMTFTWNGVLANMVPFAVNNSDWTYSGSNQFFHQFTTNVSIGPNGISRIGLPAVFNPGNANGVFTQTATIVSYSGGEIKITNNTDSQQINYFNQ